MADSLDAFLDRLDDPERSLVVHDRSSPAAARNLLEDLLDDQPVPVHESFDLGEEATEEDVVLLVEDDRILARSTMDELLSSSTPTCIRPAAGPSRRSSCPRCSSGSTTSRFTFAVTRRRTRRSCS